MEKMIIECNEAELLTRLSDAHTPDFSIYFYTPMCGTCKVAEKMLDIAIHTGDTIPVYKINVNFAPWFVKKWAIKSIPCVMIFRNHDVSQTIYAVQSVQEIYASIKK